MVHAEDFLRDHHARRAPRPRRGEPGIEFMAVAGHERGELTHGATPVQCFDERNALCHRPARPAVSSER